MKTGERLGVFEVLGPLGAGGMGEVYRALDTRLGRQVALKTLPASFAENPSRLARLRNEARILASLNHPHIATLFGLEESNGTTVLVMELVEGRTLNGLLRRGPLRLHGALDLGRQVAEALEAAHEKGVLHRDLKPSNIAIDAKGQVKLLDFGLAKAVADGGPSDSGVSTGTSPPSSPGTVVGTAPYMSPEQARGEKVDRRTDVWAFGCVLYEMLTGKRAFSGATAAATVAAVLDTDPEWGLIPEAISPTVTRLLERCLQKDPERRLRDIRDARLELEEETAPRKGPRPRQDEETPYPGLSPFTEAEAQDFFGREQDVQALWAKLKTKTLLAVIGPSGAGKTSFVRAGVVASRPEGWAAIVSTPGSAPMLKLGQALAPELAGDRDALQHLVRFEDPEAAFEALLRWRKRHAEVLLVVDQFEELFTLNPPEVQARLAELLGRLADEGGLHVLLAMRDDFLMRCQGRESLRAVFADLTPLGPPSPAGLRRALVEPAARHGYRFEDEALVDEMLASVEGERGVLPLLGFAVARLWDRREAGRKLLTREAYGELGGVTGALAQHAEATLARIGAEKQGLVREVFRNLVTAHVTRAVVDRQELLSVFENRRAAQAVLDELIGARLLTSYEVDGAEGQPSRHQVEIVHESLLTAWPRLVRWQAQDAEGAILRDQLRQAAHLWDERGRSDDLLWSGTAYREYRLWRERYPGGLTAAEEAFAQAMTALAGSRRRRRRALVAGAVGALSIGLAIVVGLWRRSERQTARAEAAARHAKAEKLLALGRLQLDDYPTAALAYATKSLELADTQEARRFAVEALWRGPTAFIMPLPPRPWPRLALSPDGQWLATANLQDQVLVSPSTGGPPIILGGHEATGAFRKVEFGGGSGLLATKAYHGDPLRVWSIPGGKLVRKIAFDGNTFFCVRGSRVLTFTHTPTGGMLVVRSWPLREGPGVLLGRLPATNAADPAVSPDGAWLALARGHYVYVRPLDALERGRERLVGSHPAKVTWIAFGPQKRLLSRDEAGGIRIWSVGSNGARLLSVLRGPAAEEFVRFDDTGTFVAAADQPGRAIRVWDLARPTGAEPLSLRRGDAFIRGLDFAFATTRARWLAVGNYGNVSFWPMTRRYPTVLAGHTLQISSVAFAPDDSWIATASYDGTVRVWPLQSQGTGPKVVLKRPVWITRMTVDPSGSRLLATDTSRDGVFLLDPQGKQPPRQLRPWDGAPEATAFDPTGRWVAVGSAYAASPEDRGIMIWDVASGRFARQLLTPVGKRNAERSGPAAGAVLSLQFAPDGSLYSAGNGGVRRWDVVRGTSESVVAGEQMTMALSRDGQRFLTALRKGRPNIPDAVVDFHDLEHHVSRRLETHGHAVFDVAFDPTGTIAVTGSGDGIVRVGPVTGEEPHLLFGHRGTVTAVAVSPDGRWIASGGQDGTLRLWPMPDVSKPPLHTLPHDALLAKLRSLTNLRVVEDPTSPTGYKLDIGPFPGWETAPTW